MKILLLALGLSVGLAGCITASQSDRRTTATQRSATPVMLGIAH